MEIEYNEIETEFSSPLAYVFEENIADTDLCISFKININNMTESDQILTIKKIISYMKANAEVTMYTHGIHTEGKKQIPHIHVHFIVNPTLAWTKAISNASQHRNRWFDKNEFTRVKDYSMKPQEVDSKKPKYNFLAYPMKEGKYFKNKDLFWFDKDPMTPDMKKFLIDYAKTLYDQKVAHDLANDRCEERKEIKYNEILLAAKGFSGSSYRDFQIYMEERYIDKLLKNGDNIPDIDNYKKNLKRAAVQLKYFKTYEI